jgi:hypothetical protein
MTYEEEVARFHRQAPLKVKSEDALSTGEVKHFVRAATTATEPSRKQGPAGAEKSAGNLGKLAKGAVKSGRAELAGEFGRAAAHEARKVAKDDDTETEDESLTEWAKEEEKEPEHAKDANAAEIAGTVKNAAHAVSNVAGHVAAGAAVGERLAQGRVVDHSPLARAIRRAAGDFNPTSSARAATSLRPKENTNYAGSGKTKQEHERVEKEYQQHRKAGHSKETAQKLAEE